MHPITEKELLNSNTSQISHWKTFNESKLILIKGLINEYIY